MVNLPTDSQPAARSHFSLSASRLPQANSNGSSDKQDGRGPSVSVGVRAKGSSVVNKASPKTHIPSSSGNSDIPKVNSSGRMARSSSAASTESAWESPSTTENSAKSARGKKDTSAAERVRVVLRVRPAMRDDESSGSLELCPDGASVKLYRMGAVVPETRYTYDKVLGPNSTQADVYEAAVAPVIADVMNGYNGTIMAYGQTGAGKTHTLSSIEPDNIGMMPRAAAEVFVQANSDPLHDYVVLMSYVQIYMELIQDLLRPESENLVIRENESGVFISGVQEVQVKKMEDCLQLLQLGERNRAFAFTQLNAHSSRSHAIVLMTVLKRKKPSSESSPAREEVKVRVGKLFIVDLAGSERLKKSKSEGQRQREATSINRSLTNLGMCINARTDPNCQHVPFRDSKLTRLLQESLGGNAKTSLVLAASDVREHAEETQQSLQFGSRAMCVKTHPVVNEQVDFKALHAEVLMQLDTRRDSTNVLEATLQAKDEEMAKLQEAMREEQEQNLAIMRALEMEKQELHEIRQREAEQVEMMLQQKQGEIEKHQSELQSSVAELEHRDKEISDREARLEELFKTVQDKDALLREFSDEKERLSRELQIAKADGTELASQISSLRAGMAEASRDAAAERERLMVSWEHQQETANSLRADKDDLTARLHASENETHTTRLQVETARQKLEMETQRMAAEAELLRERMGNQAALERDALVHKHQLEVQALQDSLRQSEQKCASLKQEAEEQRRQLAAEVEELHKKLADVQAEATSTQRRLEDLVEEAQSSLLSLQAEHQEALVQQGLLIGSNKSLQDRVESLVEVMAEQQEQAEERLTDFEADRDAQSQAKQREHERRVADLSRKLQEMEKDMRKKLTDQEDTAKLNGAASVIQRNFRRKKLTELVGAKAHTEEQLESTRRKAAELENHRMLLEAQRVSGMALTGRQLVQHTTVLAQASVNDLLAAFLVPTRELAKIEKANRARERFTTGDSSSTPSGRSSLGGMTPRRMSIGGGSGTYMQPLSPRLDKSVLCMSSAMISPRDQPHNAAPPPPPATSVSLSSGPPSSTGS